MRPSRRVTVARLAVLAVFLLGTTGVIYGYPALKPVMVDEGVYGRLCANMSASDANAQTPCTAQSLRLDLMFTVGAMAPTVGIANGFLVDRLGARLMVLAGAIGLALSAVLFAFSDDAGLDAFIPSYAGLGIFGQVIMQSSMTLSSLMPERSGLILSFYNTAFDASAVVFVVLDAVYRGSGAPSLRALFVGYAAVPALLALCVYVIVPSSEEFAQATRERTSSSMTLRLRKGDDQLAMEQGPARPQLTYKEVYLANALMEAPLKDQLRSPLLWLAVYCVSVYQMRLNFYMSTIDNQLRQLTDTATAEAMTSAFAIILPVAGVAIAAPVGWLLDSQRISTVQLIVFGSGVMFGVTMLVPNTALQYVSFLVVSAFRPMMYASFADFIGRIFGWGVSPRGVRAVLTCDAASPTLACCGA
eukprot:Unigene12121_Nuclearia_a/m.36853 Unigene12121_Nuclearia_a/g.36853  ORF Unigene12121_Nuclearia_a/g.36853 Unigene12121_Nuclearia_a/m.36853 type:complete len:416 (-) Unigene12121_Nuclearia_a:347-1594(-)